MDNWKLTTPVAFFVFNRPETTARVLGEIARVKPPKLLLVADGPRAGRPGEAELCALVRGVVSRVHWPCEVVTNYAETNLGCKRRLASGLDWVFDQVEEAIILEDDTLPHASFFRFCEEALIRYRHDYQIMQINGTNLLGRGTHSNRCRFSHIFNIWGWATWRRAWRLYDITMACWPFLRDSGETKRLFPKSYGWVLPLFEAVAKGVVDTWDVQWVATCHACAGLSIMPEANLVQNIGFGADATHNKNPHSSQSLPLGSFLFPVVFPPVRHVDPREDDRCVREAHRPSLVNRLLQPVQRAFSEMRAKG